MFLNCHIHLLVFRVAVAGSVYSCRVDPCLPLPLRSCSSLVGFRAGAIVAIVAHAGVHVGPTAVLVLVAAVQAMRRAQYVVGILGLPGSIACGGCCSSIAGGIGAANGSTISAAAGGPVLIVPPCGLGLIPISSIVQKVVLSRRQKRGSR